MKEIYVCRRDERSIGGRRAKDEEGEGVRGTGCNRGARGAQAEPGPPSLSVEPCGGSNMHQLFGGSRRDVSSLPLPPRLRVHPMSNVQLHHTSHSRYIRRHNVGVRAQHASSSRRPLLLSFACVFLDR